MRAVLAVVFLAAALWRAGVDWQATIGQGYAYRLGRVFGFERELATELGYGRAVHHVLRHVAERARESGAVPAAAEIEGIIDRELYVPFANQATFANMARNVRFLVDRYVREWAGDLERALLDPTLVFHDPEEVLRRDDFTQDQKVMILQRWAYDARQLEVAEGEGMRGDGEPDVLDRILRALDELEATSARG